MTEPRVSDEFPAVDNWVVEEGVSSVVCPDCAFTFAAEHTASDGGGYSCPCCAEVRLQAEIKRLRNANLPAEDKCSCRFIRCESCARDRIELTEQVQRRLRKCCPATHHEAGYGACECECHPPDAARDFGRALDVIDGLRAEVERLGAMQ